MTERLFLYIDILGFKDLVMSNFDITEIYKRIDELNVHRDGYFKCIVFSDTILVYGDGYWLSHKNEGIMWLLEFAQDLVYRLISIDVNIRGYLTTGDFEYYKMNNIESYFGTALVKCHEKEKTIKCTGIFIDKSLVRYCDIFRTTEYDAECHYVHILQILDSLSYDYEYYPLDKIMVEDTTGGWWEAYALRYLKNTFEKSRDKSLHNDVRLKHQNAWKMISAKHSGLTSCLEENNFNLNAIVDMDWSEPLRRIGTEEGSWY